MAAASSAGGAGHAQAMQYDKYVPVLLHHGGTKETDGGKGEQRGKRTGRGLCIVWSYNNEEGSCFRFFILLFFSFALLASPRTLACASNRGCLFGCLTLLCCTLCLSVYVSLHARQAHFLWRLSTFCHFCLGSTLPSCCSSPVFPFATFLFSLASPVLCPQHPAARVGPPYGPCCCIGGRPSRPAFVAALCRCACACPSHAIARRLSPRRSSHPTGGCQHASTCPRTARRLRLCAAAAGSVCGRCGDTHGRAGHAAIGCAQLLASGGAGAGAGVGPALSARACSAPAGCAHCAGVSRYARPSRSTAQSR